MGGVILIITKRGKGPPTFNLEAEGGSHSTFRESAAVSGSEYNFDYSFNVTRLDSEGISAANADNGNTEKDAYGNLTLVSRLGFTPIDKIENQFFLRFIKTKKELDQSIGGDKVVEDDPNSVTRAQSLYLKNEVALFLIEDLYTQKHSLSYSSHDRSNIDNTDGTHPTTSSTSHFEGDLIKYALINELRLKDQDIVAGFDFERESMNSDSTSQIGSSVSITEFQPQEAKLISVYLEDHYKGFDPLFVNLGGRFDHHEKFGGVGTYRFAGAYLIREVGVKMRASVGSAYKSPSLFQLYAAGFGNIDLKPERSVGWDAGVEKVWIDKRLSTEVTYFRNDFEKMINFNPETSTYENIDEVQAYGVELGSQFWPISSLNLELFYTYLRTKDLVSGQELPRRARHKMRFSANYEFWEDLSGVGLTLLYHGRRKVPEEVAQNENLDPYFLLALNSYYHISSKVKLTGRIENLLNTQYEEIKGYGTSGISAYLGISAEL